jgi:hypothetical protein
MPRSRRVLINISGANEGVQHWRNGHCIYAGRKRAPRGSWQNERLALRDYPKTLTINAHSINLPCACVSMNKERALSE